MRGNRIWRPLGLVIAPLLFVDLMLHWRQAPVKTQYLDESAATWALDGWGLAVPPLLAGFLFAEVVLRRGRIALGFAVAAAGVTILEFATGVAGVIRIGGDVVQAAPEETLWPAYAGVGIALALVAAAALRLLEQPRAMLPLPPLPASAMRRTGEAGGLLGS